MTDSNLFQLLTEAFQTEYRVNLSLERPDGSIVLTLSSKRGIAVERLIRPAQLHDPEQLQRMVKSIRFDIAIENDTNASQLLQAITQGKAR